MHYCSRIPLAVGQKLLKIARFGIWNNLNHAIHIFTQSGLHQSTGVLEGLFGDIMAVRAEVLAIAFQKRHKAPADACKRRLRHPKRIDWQRVLLIQTPNSEACDR